MGSLTPLLESADSIDSFCSSTSWTLSASSSIAYSCSFCCFFCFRLKVWLLLEERISDPTIEKVKLVPMPCTDSTEMLPPSYSQSCLQMESPTPLLIRVLIFSSVWPPNGSNILCRYSFDMPWPLSTTWILITALLSSWTYTSEETVISPTR